MIQVDRELTDRTDSNMPHRGSEYIYMSSSFTWISALAERSTTISNWIYTLKNARRTPANLPMVAERGVERWKSETQLAARVT